MYHTLVTGHRAIKLVLHWKILLWWLALPVPEDALQAAVVEKLAAILPSWEPREPQSWLAW